MSNILEGPNPDELKPGQLYRVIEGDKTTIGETRLSLVKVEDAPEEKSLREEMEDERKGQHYNRLPRRSRWTKVSVVRAEIEMPNEVYELITSTILEYSGDPSINDFISDRFMERMRQILNDPAEFGKLMLEGVWAAHCLENAELRD